jgi:hypothetical protein
VAANCHRSRAAKITTGMRTAVTRRTRRARVERTRRRMAYDNGFN